MKSTRVAAIASAIATVQMISWGVALGQGESDSLSQLAEVTVTAQRREENLNKVPVSITALSQKSLDDLAVQGVADLPRIVPGLVIPHMSSSNNANPDIAIRGIFSGGNTPTTQMYIDETPIAIRTMRSAGPAGSFFPDIFDLERVEVLRGPQGTLFGSSAMGGAIRFITPQPNLIDPSGYVKAQVGVTDSGDPSYAVGAAYGMPLAEGKAGLRLSGWYHADGGYLDAKNPFTQALVKENINGSSAFAGRGAFTWVPADGLTITAALHGQYQKVNDISAYWVTPNLGEHVSGDSPWQPNHDKMTVPSLAIKWNLPGVSFQSDTSYLYRDYDTFDDTTQLIEAVRARQILVAGLPADFQILQHQFGGTRAVMQQFRLTSTGESRLQWVAGAFFRSAHETLTQYVTPNLDPLTQVLYEQTSLQHYGVPDYVVNGQALNQLTDFNTVDEEESVFGNVSFDVTKRFKASFGLRVERSVVSHQTQTIAGPLTGVAFSSIQLPDQRETPVTPRFALTYQYTDRDMVYATAGKGYRSGGANSGRADSPNCLSSLQELGLGAAPDTFKSDSLWSYEVGAKDALLDGRLSIQSSVYYVDWKNIQTSIALPSCGQNFTGNRGHAVVQGFELQVEAVPLDGLKLGGSAGYTDGYYPDALYGATSGGVRPLLNGAGDKLGVVLPWTAAARAEYSWGIGSLWSNTRAFARTDYRWQDGVAAGNPTVANYNVYADRFRDPAYSTLNLSTGVMHAGVEISVYADNVTRSDPQLSFTNIGFRAPNYPLAYVSAIRPFTVGLMMTSRF